ncbi:hypothetical protein LI177_02735 [bacterium 210820-DFI.6.37]|nr:hypothetical protein [bacterium 210820-DFI.6.37]
MAKKPKEKWQVAVRAKLEEMGIGYKELAERMGEKEGCVRQAMCKPGMPILKKKIRDYLNIHVDEE